MDIDLDALVITRDEITIAAPVECVWELFTDVSAWPKWQKEIDRASLEGELAVGTTFSWTTAGLNITSTVGEFIPRERIAWSGLVRGIMGIHVWRFTAVDSTTVVHTEESWEGASVRPQAPFFQKALDRSIRTWLENLKRAAERPAP